MNKQARQEMVIRIASKKMARMEKQAHFLSGIQEKLTALFMKEADQRVQKELKGQSSASKVGLLFLVPVKSIFAILKQVFTGAVKVGKAIISELKEYLIENASLLKSAFPNLSNWLSESRVFSPREQDQLAMA